MMRSLRNTVEDFVSTVQYRTVMYSTILAHAFLRPRNVHTFCFRIVFVNSVHYTGRLRVLWSPMRTLSGRSLYVNASLYGWFTSLNTVEKSVPKFEFTIKCAHYTGVQYTDDVVVYYYIDELAVLWTT
jgi:hypothetical protein